MTLIGIMAASGITLALIACGRLIARRRGRGPFTWGLVAALFPPALLLLAVLPRRADHPSVG